MRPLRKRASRFLSLLCIIGSVLLLAACGMTEAPQTTFVPQGSGADEVLKLFKPVFWVAVGVFVIVEGLLIFSVIRYRRKPQDGIPLQIHGNTPIEIAWTVLPAIIVVGIATLTFRTQAILAQPEPNPLRIEVIGHQWWWEFRYPELGVVTANEVHLPANRGIEFSLESEDVIHSFWIPRLSGKTDVIPGHTNFLAFRTYDPISVPVRGQCAEFCGGTHAMMGLWAIVQSPEDFDAWVAEQQQAAVVPAGVEQAPPPPGAAVGATVEAAAEATPSTANPGPTSVVSEPEIDTAATVEPTANAPVAGGDPAAQPASLEVQGYQLFQQKGCIGCHAITGYPGAVSRIGPDLTHIGGRNTLVSGWLENTPENMRRWLRNPNEVKPENLMGSVIKLGTLKPDEIEALSAYLFSLK